MKTAENGKCSIFDHSARGFSAIVVAAGAGQRAGAGQPKQYRMFLGRPVFAHSAHAFLQHGQLKKIIVVCPVGDLATMNDYLNVSGLTDRQRLAVVEGGASRTESVRAGLAALGGIETDAVLIHDAARPGLTSQIIDELLSALKSFDGAAPAIAVVDALKERVEDRIVTRSRDNLFRIQTPQAFRPEVIEACMNAGGVSANDEFELAEGLGARLTLTHGTESLAKLTYPEDFARMERLLGAFETRMGLGYDVHAFENGSHVTLCGIEVPHTKSLKGHSDADVAWHALTDALLGAIGAGDIGDHFPPSDPQWKGAPSRVFLAHAARLVRDAGGIISNVDVTIICEAPKIKPHREAMIENTAQIIGISPDRVSVKATTTEKLGFEGREEGISAQAIASVRLPLPLDMIG